MAEEPGGPFAAPPGGWTRVSPRLATIRRLVTAVVLTPIGTVAAAASWLLVGPAASAGAAVLALTVMLLIWVLVGRQCRAIGYAERADDLLVVRGVMFRELTVVPYGRMQFVDVAAGPLQRRYGVAKVELHTAASTTDASIPGVPADEAARLRDRLAAFGEARAAGL